MDDTIQIEAVRMLPDGRMNTDNAGKYLGLAPKTLAMMRSDGTGPAFVKISNRVFYKKSELDCWIDGNSGFTSTAQARIKG